jgi:hypothetical protein
VTPFLGFAIWLVLRGKPIMSKDSWNGAGGWLAIAGLVIIILSFVWIGLNAERGEGAYEPAHSENGTIVPGRIR